MSKDRDDNVFVLPGARLPDPEPTEAEEEVGAAAVEEIGALAPPRPEFLVSAVEAVLFAMDRPASFTELHAALAGPPVDALKAALSTLQEGYLRRAAGVRLVEVAGGWQIRTVPQAAGWVAAARGGKPMRLSRSAVETLAIVAYRQPVTRGEVEDIRGVDSGGVLRMLLERRLLQVMGRKDEPGRPITYGTTPAFLELFGLKDLSDLPTLRDLRELKADDPRDGPVPPQLEFPDF